MIVVLADDLSGAAELAGVAYSLGCTAEVQTRFNPLTSSQVVALDTDTRSQSESTAAAALLDIARHVVQARPAWIYKKTDSVLRGHIAAEISALLQATQQPRALLIPANPSKARTIQDGTYAIQGTPLHQTAFAHDPLFPAQSASVVERLQRPDALPIHSIRLHEPLPPHGIVVPDVHLAEHPLQFARQLDAHTLPAGGVDFFRAILELRRPPHPNQPAAAPATKSQSGLDRTLFVCGSAAAWQTGRADQCRQHHIPVVTMPEDLYQGTASSEGQANWAARALTALDRAGRVMLAIGRSEISADTHASPAELLDRLVAGAAHILQNTHVDQVALEGGATAAALLHGLGWTCLQAEHRLTVDLIGFRPVTSPTHPGLSPLLYIKPGSYPWPAPIWTL